MFGAASQRNARPRAQIRHFPHDPSGEAATGWPSRHPVTSRPAPAIRPLNSCPRICPSAACPFCRVCTSEPQSPQASTSTTTSSGAGVGSGTSVTTACVPLHSTARTVCLAFPLLRWLGWRRPRQGAGPGTGWGAAGPRPACAPPLSLIPGPASGQGAFSSENTSLSRTGSAAARSLCPATDYRPARILPMRCRRACLDLPLLAQVKGHSAAEWLYGTICAVPFRESLIQERPPLALSLGAMSSAEDYEW